MSTPSSRPNILLITADDMNWDAVGAFGCPVPETTPNLDQLAADGLRFHHAHVTIAVCQPSRSALMTGRYPHRSGGEGFYNLRHPGIPILPDLL
ncbi:MAG: sulfatase-like hydrolase/transferase, partial [Victivallales bacterium]|nr:sulfatase-like hydrolase/transferase [Victivallales bacterium]